MEKQKISKAAKSEIKKAKQLLEDPNFIIELANIIGEPIEYLFEKLPTKAAQITSKAVEKSLWWALEATLFTINNDNSSSSSPNFHKVLASISGGVGGFFGLAALSAELPISTGVILRSIVDIARSEGEDIGLYETKIECINVLALSGPSSRDDATESGYYATRAGLSKIVSEASKYVAEELAKKGTKKAVQKAIEKKAAEKTSEKSIPILVQLIQKIAERFGVTVSNKVIAQLVPVLGAIGGAAINTIFIHHYQNIARGHFMIRRLERQYGIDIVKEEYEKAKI